MWAVAAATPKASEPEETSAASTDPDLRPPQLSSDVERAVQPSPTQIQKHLSSCQPSLSVSTLWPGFQQNVECANDKTSLYFIVKPVRLAQLQLTCTHVFE